jgi:hypothetical protein
MKLKEYAELISQLLCLGFQLANRPARSEDNGKWNCNNDMTIAVVEGQVYIREGLTNDPKTLQVLAKLCHQGPRPLASPSLNALLDPSLLEAP